MRSSSPLPIEDHDLAIKETINKGITDLVDYFLSIPEKDLDHPKQMALQTKEHFIYVDACDQEGVGRDHHLLAMADLISRRIPVAYLAFLTKESGTLSYNEFEFFLDQLVLDLPCSKSIRTFCLIFDNCGDDHFFLLDLYLAKGPNHETSGSVVMFDPAEYSFTGGAIHGIAERANNINLKTYYTCSVIKRIGSSETDEKHSILKMQNNVSSCGELAFQLIRKIIGIPNFHLGLERLHQETITNLNPENSATLKSREKKLDNDTIHLLPWSAFPELLPISQSSTFWRLHSPTAPKFSESQIMAYLAGLRFSLGGTPNPDARRKGAIHLCENNLLTVARKKSFLCEQRPVETSCVASTLQGQNLYDYLKSSDLSQEEKWKVLTTVICSTLNGDILGSAIQIKAVHEDYCYETESDSLRFIDKHRSECRKDPEAYASNMQKILENIESEQAVVDYVLSCHQICAMDSESDSADSESASTLGKRKLSTSSNFTLFSSDNPSKRHCDDSNHAATPRP